MSLLSCCCWGQVPFNYEMNRRRGTTQSLLFGLIIADRRWAGDNLGRRDGSWNRPKRKRPLRLCGGDNETSGLIYGHLFVGESLLRRGGRVVCDGLYARSRVIFFKATVVVSLVRYSTTKLILLCDTPGEVKPSLTPECTI